MNTEQKGWRKALHDSVRKSWGFIDTPEKQDAMVEDYEKQEYFIERTLQEQREEMVRRIAELKYINVGHAIYDNGEPCRACIIDGWNGALEKTIALIKDTKPL